MADSPNFDEAAEALFRLYGGQSGAHPATLQELIAREFRQFYRRGLIDGMETVTEAVEDSGQILRESLKRMKETFAKDHGQLV